MKNRRVRQSGLIQAVLKHAATCLLLAGLTAAVQMAVAQGMTAQELAKNAVGADNGRELPTTDAMASEKAVLEAYVTAWNKHDFAALDKLLAPDAIHEDIAWPSREQGPSKIKEFMRGMIEAEPDLEWRLTKVVEGGPTVAAEWTWTATYTGDTPIGPVVKEAHLRAWCVSGGDRERTDQTL